MAKSLSTFFCIEAPGKHASNFEDYVDFFRQIMLNLAPCAISKLQHLKENEEGFYQSESEKKHEWKFAINGVRFFVITTCGLYDENSSRFSGGDTQDRVLIMFQPMYSFGWKFDEYEREYGGDKNEAKNIIRKNFDTAKRPFHSGDFWTKLNGDEYHEAPKYLLPLKESDGSIAWWSDGKK